MFIIIFKTSEHFDIWFHHQMSLCLSNLSNSCLFLNHQFSDPCTKKSWSSAACHWFQISIKTVLVVGLNEAAHKHLSPGVLWISVSPQTLETEITEAVDLRFTSEKCRTGAIFFSHLGWALTWTSQCLLSTGVKTLVLRTFGQWTVLFHFNAKWTVLIPGILSCVLSPLMLLWLNRSDQRP